MEKLTEPGTTKMWDGWFTVHWIPIIMDMASRQNHNAKRANTYSETHQTCRKRKERDQTRPGENGRKVKRKPRKKMVQNTLIQYMNTSGSGKRKRNQVAHGGTNGNNKSDSVAGQGTKKPKRTPPRQTETTKRKGIG